MKDVIIKCDKGEVKRTLAYIEKKDRKVKWATGEKPTEWGCGFDRHGVYLVIERDELTFIEVDEFNYTDAKGKAVVSAQNYIGKNPSIVIFRRDRNVIAKNVATGNEGIAKCSPTDEFCFKTGASIALARLMAKTPDVLTDDVKAEWKKVLGLTPVEKRVYTDADRNFKVGDRVVVRDWDDMAKEYGVSRLGYIEKDSNFTDSMKHLCGRTATVTGITDGFGYKKVKVDFDDKSGSTWWTFNPWMFNPTDIPTLEKEKPESKFKVGDYVTLKEGLTADKWYGGLKLLQGAMYDNAHNQRMTVVRVDWANDSGTYYYECKGNSRFITFHYSEEMLEKWDESKIHECDKVRIKESRTGARYDTYYDWVKKHITDPDLLIAFEREDHIDTSLDYEVVKIAPHEILSTTLAYIKHKDGYRTLCYLFNIEALEKV